MTHKKHPILLIRLIKTFCIAVALTTFMACNTNSNSIPVTNLHVLYEQDASIHGTLQKKAWSDITCPSDIENYDPSKDTFNCVCMQKQGWKKIERLTDIELHDPALNNVNFIWIKGEFYIEGDPEQYQGVRLENVRGRDVIYINNSLAGIKNVDRFANYYGPSHYKVYPGILKKGKNSVYVRLEIITAENRGVSPYLFIQPQNDYRQTQFRYSAINRHFDILFSILFAIFIYSTARAIFDKNKMIHIVSSAALLYYIVFGILTTIPFNYLNVIHLYQFLYSIDFVFSIIFIMYFQALYGVVLSRVNTILVPLIITSGVLYSYIYPIAQWPSVIALLIVYYFSVPYVLFKANSLKPDTRKFVFLSCIMTIFIICRVHYALSYKIEIPYWTANIDKSLYFYTLLVFSVYGVIFSAFAKRKKRIHMEQLYAQFVEQQNRQPEGITITGSSEEKLDRVINFINQNYSENLSREDLAAIIDMNPSHFSSIFNSYTGKKIQEYINMLRIKEAAQLIKETDKKIIDIAFSVGFENLSTFIRAFKKETGKTPSDYREDGIIQHGANVFTMESTAE